MQKPVCSVVIPAYNCEAYIVDCLQSVQTQTQQEIEILVIDDCSADHTASIVRDMAKEDVRIRYFQMPQNQGVSAARNYGVQQAKSDWIAFLDSDDVWQPEKLGAQLSLQASTGAVLCYTGAMLLDTEGRPMSRIHVPEAVTHEELLCGNVISTSGVLCNRSVLLRFPMERDDLHEDFICWLRILSEYGPAAGIDQPLHGIRLTKGSRSRNKWSSACKTWRTYRYIKLPLGKRIRCFARYALHGVRRYLIRKDAI